MVPHECFHSSLCRQGLNILPVIVGKLPKTYKHEAYASAQTVRAYMQTEKRDHFYLKKGLVLLESFSLLILL